MRLVPNPAWIHARFELRLLLQNGDVVDDPYPHRFLLKDKEKIIKLMEEKDWQGLLALSVSRWIKAPTPTSPCSQSSASDNLPIAEQQPYHPESF